MVANDASTGALKAFDRATKTFRRISHEDNAAAGRYAASPELTDAVNVAQLKKVSGDSVGEAAERFSSPERSENSPVDEVAKLPVAPSIAVPAEPEIPAVQVERVAPVVAKPIRFQKRSYFWSQH